MKLDDFLIQLVKYCTYELDMLTKILLLKNYFIAKKLLKNEK